MLELQGYDSIEDPVKAENGVKDHGYVVHPDFLVSESLSEKAVFCGGVTEAPVHNDVPYAAIYGIDNSKGNENSAICLVFLEAIDTEGDVEENSGCIFSAIHQMREDISSIVVTAHALERSPNPGKSAEKAE